MKELAAMLGFLLLLLSGCGDSAPSGATALPALPTETPARQRGVGTYSVSGSVTTPVSEQLTGTLDLAPVPPGPLPGNLIFNYLIRNTRLHSASLEMVQTVDPAGVAASFAALQADITLQINGQTVILRGDGHGTYMFDPLGHLLLSDLSLIGGGFAMKITTSPKTAFCAGDCSSSGVVTITDILKLVNIALGTASPSACPHGVPSGIAVDITLIVQALNNALTDCATGLAVFRPASNIRPVAPRSTWKLPARGRQCFPLPRFARSIS